MPFIIPYRTHSYHSPLSEAEITATIRKHAHIGEWDGLLFANKPYFGILAPGYFEIRESGSRKRYSMKPILYAYLQLGGSGHEVTLALKPHGFVLGLAVLLVGSCVMFLLQHLLNFFRTFDAAPVIQFVFTTAIMAGIFILPFHLMAERTLQFWKRELQLRD